MFQLLDSAAFKLESLMSSSLIMMAIYDRFKEVCSPHITAFKTRYNISFQWETPWTFPRLSPVQIVVAVGEDAVLWHPETEHRTKQNQAGQHQVEMSFNQTASKSFGQQVRYKHKSNI